MSRQLHRTVLACALATAVACVPVLPAAAAAPADSTSIGTFVDRFAGWLDALGAAFAVGASEGETMPFMDPNGAMPHLDPNGVTQASGDGEAQDTPDDSQDAMPYMDPNG